MFLRKIFIQFVVFFCCSLYYFLEFLYVVFVDWKKGWQNVKIQVEALQLPLAFMQFPNELPGDCYSVFSLLVDINFM